MSPREERMSNDRREFMKIAGATAAAAGAALTAMPAAAQRAMPGQFKAIKALAFDAYGTLFDVFSVTALCEQLFPGKGNQLAQIWRFKQLQYSLMRSLMGRHRDFWGLTEDGLVWASKNLSLDLTADKKNRLMDAYLSLAAFPDRKSTRLNSSHLVISYAVFCLKKKNRRITHQPYLPSH